MREPVRANVAGAQAEGGRLAANILGFARLLRSAGLPIGSRKVLEATEAVMAAGLDDPKAFYWTLHAVFVSRPTERELFNQAFHLIWRDPIYIQQILSAAIPSPPSSGAEAGAVARRLADSLFLRREARNAVERQELQIDASGPASDLEALATKDFEQMTADELRQVQRAVIMLAQSLAKRRTRRLSATGDGGGRRLDLRRMLRRAGMHGADAVLPLYKERQRRAPPLVVICDISGSMDSYASLILHFLYGLINGGEPVSAFLFGTRLTNVTRILKDRDPDAAIRKAAGAVQDWSGGTRIGESLHSFNKIWARRVLGQNATVLLFTDGLDRSGAEGLAREARRLRASCRELIWLNPLLRYDNYEPLAAGAAQLDRYVSETRPCHNLSSVADLAEILSRGRYSAAFLSAKKPLSRSLLRSSTSSRPM